MTCTLLTAALLAGIPGIGLAAGAPTPIAGIEATVRHRVDQAQQPQPGELQRDLRSRFDTFYSPGTGLVENNAAWDQAALFAFDKWVATQGHPLVQRYPWEWW
jgi:hypothetical protein